MEVLLVIAVALAALLVVLGPLRPGAVARSLAAEESVRADLEAAKDAKLAEIRELELDYRTGKLSDADYRAQDRALRAEAVAILKRIDQLGVADEPSEPVETPPLERVGSGS